MFDIGWGELLLIGAVALVVIGPQELPKALRTLGNMTTKLRRMASDFQSQFNEAMREAELDEIRKSVASVGDVAKDLNQGFNPIQTIRDEIKGAIDAKPEAPAVKIDTPSAAEPTMQLADVPPVPDARGVVADAAAGAPLDIATTPEPADRPVPEAPEPATRQAEAEPKAGSA